MRTNKQKEVLPNPLDLRDEEIRAFFKPLKSPYHFLTYEEILKNFPVQQNNFKDENTNIIDIHLRYRQYVREKMAPYKWLPILAMTPVLFRSIWLVAIIPYFTASMFDHYFERFFLWRHRQDRIINMRNEFVSKLSKEKNKVRRIHLFQTLKDKLMRKDEPQEGIEPPLKYIKFGQYTQYLFHSNIGENEETGILQTTIFDTYLSLKHFIFGFGQFSIIKQIISSFKNDFSEFRKDPDRNKYCLNLNPLIDIPEIKDSEIYTLEDNIEQDIKRLSELLSYSLFGRVDNSEFKLWKFTNFSSYEDIFDPIKYNIKNNNSDLLLYYSILAVPKFLSMIFKRR